MSFLTARPDAGLEQLTEITILGKGGRRPSALELHSDGRSVAPDDSAGLHLMVG